MASSRKYDELLKAWTGWHKIAVELRPLYQEFVGLANEGAKEIGYTDLGELWRAGYDMSPAELRDRRPSGCGRRCSRSTTSCTATCAASSADKYGKDKVPEDGLIPAHLLGNMWAQEWANIYPLVEPFPGPPASTSPAR